MGQFFFITLQEHYYYYYFNGKRHEVMMLSLEFTIFSYTVMYLVHAPPFPHPPQMQNISFVLLGL